MASEISEQDLLEILEAARWAPSGDNHQPWRFRILNQQQIMVLGHDTREQVLYDLDGHASHIALGALLETIRIAASHKQLQCEIEQQGDEDTPQFIIHFHHVDAMVLSPLFPFIEQRRVQRRALATQGLSAQHKQALEQCLEPGMRVLWLDGFSNRWQLARLMFRNAGLRLSLPEAYPVHRDAIEWNTRYSVDRIPDAALGVDPLTAKAMRWAMHSWKRLRFMNRYLAGSLLPRIEMDFYPALACGAHFVLLAAKAPQDMSDYLDAGSHVQRFWLTATRLGLHLQPEHTPLVFHQYVTQQRDFSARPEMFQRAHKISTGLQNLVGKEALTRAVFMGRIGYGHAAASRSLRLEVNELLDQ